MGDESLRREVESLLAYQTQAEEFIEAPALQVAAELLTDEPLRLAQGQQLGPYKIIAPLGAGGMGEVYRARDTRLGREVALKVLPAAFADNPERLRRFEQGARAAGLLNHPNILAIYDVGAHEGVPFVVSELLEGETLRSRLKRRALAARKAIDYPQHIPHDLAP